MPDPIVILQMQRMGDLVLSFPLLSWLERSFPDHPVYVVAEEIFFRELVPFSPKCLYLPWQRAEELLGRSFRLAVNLSHRPEAARLAGRLKAAQIIGPVITAQGKYIHGPWQLYRASLTHNNRHNTFHWADLNALDVIPRQAMAAALWPPPRPAQTAGRPKIGLFLGASQEHKRPDPAFWARLAEELLRLDLRPLLLGGPAEKNLAAEVLSRMKYRAPDFSGHFSLMEFARFSSSLSLMVTPDTGPMHVAAWLGLTTLNLSLGPVNPWETGPYQPGHLVMQARKSCVGCWECARERAFCREVFPARSVAALIQARVQGGLTEFLSRKTPLPASMTLWRTGRSKDGLYSLELLAGQAASGRQVISELWRDFFGAWLGLWEHDRLRQSCSRLAETRLAKPLKRDLDRLALDLLRAFKKNDLPLPEHFWSSYAPMLRPLAGYLQLMLPNMDYSRPAFNQAIDLIDTLKMV